MSLASVFDPRGNSLNALRLVLAAMVIVSHSWALGGYGPEPELGGVNLGTWAVFGFFGISGFLITRSRLSGKPAGRYYQARFLRIFPGFAVCLIVVAFVFAPLSLLLGSPGSFEFSDTFGYVARNLFLYPPVLGQTGVGSTLSNIQYSDVWNGPLWTLFWEAGCYVLIGVLVSIIPRRHFRRTLSILFIAATIGSVAGHYWIAVPELIVRVMPMLTAFLGGALIFLYGHCLSLKAAAPLAAVFLAFVASTSMAVDFAALPFTFLLLLLGSVLPFKRIGSRYDLSYGMYIYGWPVQQSLALAFPVGSFGVAGFVALSIAGTLPLAMASCYFVERPAMALRQRPVLLSSAPNTGTLDCDDGIRPSARCDSTLV